jgi:hypothetical protein
MTPTANLILLSGATLIAAGVYIVRRPSGGSVATKRTSTDIPAGWMPVLDADALIQRNGVDGLLNSIRAKVGLNTQNYRRDCLTTRGQFF